MSEEIKNDELCEEENEVTEETVEDEIIENDEIDQLKEKVSELETKYLMAYADAQNLIKRNKIDSDNKILNRISGVMDGILPALDNFERALNSKSEDAAVNNFLKGFEMVYKQLYQALENEGIKQIDTVGQVFDPNIHQAVMQVEDENYESNIVVEELQKGYTFNGRTLRVALVKVNQ